MVHRSDAGKTQLFKDQYSLLKSGIERFYQGDEVKDGGAHVDPDVPRRHVIASEPPFVIGVTKDNLVRPNFARLTVAQAGNELLDYLYRHFAKYLA